MKQILNAAAATFVLCVVAGHASAQKGDVKFDFNYTYSMPAGNFKNNIIGNGSPVGGSGAIMFSLSDVLSLGGSLGFQDYYQKYPRALYQTGKDETTSAVLSNSISSLPVTARLVYSPLGKSGSPVKPYISASAGISFVGFEQDLGEFGGVDNSISFVAQGGAGIMIPFGKLGGSGLRFGANYSYMPYNRDGVGSLCSIDFQGGVYFPLR